MYISEALVCGSRDTHTSDRSYLLFTREGGMIWASAKSAREERSKHRYALQDFSCARVSLVRGKAGWRLTGAEPLQSLYYGARLRSDRTLLRNIVRVLRRFLHGETPVPHMYDDVIDVLSSAHADTVRAERTLTLRILSVLGYVAPQKELRMIIDAESSKAALGSMTDTHEGEIERAITRAFESSQL